MLREDGKVIWNLRKPWRDGTRSFVFDPLAKCIADGAFGRLDTPSS
jgi:hypothetical protein